MGKSTLVEHFLATSGVPSAFFTAAARADLAAERAEFAREIAQSPLDAAAAFSETTFETWDAVFRALAVGVSAPSVVVLDEFPFLAAADPSFEGVLQRAWDRHLSRVPLLLVLVGSDLAAMEMLTTHDRPLFGRTVAMVLDPLTVADTATLLGVDAAGAFDAQVVTGGLPRLVGEMRALGLTDPLAFVDDQLRDATSPLVVLGERSLAAEFPRASQAREVLGAIGPAEVAFSRLADRAGIAQASLSRSLRTLGDKRVVAAEQPLAAVRGRSVTYRIRDPYLRFWLGFVGPELDRVVRGRGDLASARFRDSWPSYVGRAVEPLVRAALERTLPRPELGTGASVGRYWSRDGRVEVDIVVADRDRPPAAVSAVGSVTWRVARRFDRRDLAELHAVRARVPGAEEARTVVVSRAGSDVTDVDLALRPEDLL